MNTVNFKNTEYKVLENHNVPALLEADGLKAQMTIVGKRGATKLLQIWNTRFGEMYKTITVTGKVEVELK